MKWNGKLLAFSMVLFFSSTVLKVVSKSINVGLVFFVVHNRKTLICDDGK